MHTGRRFPKPRQSAKAPFRLSPGTALSVSVQLQYRDQQHLTRSGLSFKPRSFSDGIHGGTVFPGDLPQGFFPSSAKDQGRPAGIRLLRFSDFHGTHGWKLLPGNGFTAQRKLCGKIDPLSGYVRPGRCDAAQRHVHPGVFMGRRLQFPFPPGRRRLKRALRRVIEHLERSRLLQLQLISVPSLSGEIRKKGYIR